MNNTKTLSKLQRTVRETPALKFYRNSKPVQLSVDASSCEVDAVIMQGNCTAAFASKAFTDTQKRWTRIESLQRLYLDVKDSAIHILQGI